MKPEEVIIPLNVNLDQLNLIITGLAKLPYERVADLITAVRASAYTALVKAEEEANNTELSLPNEITETTEGN